MKIDWKEVACLAREDLGTRITKLCRRLHRCEISQAEFETAFDDIIRSADPTEFANCQPLYAVWF